MNKYLLALVIGAVFALSGSATAQAASLSGWAWSETFGWISFRSTDAGAGGGPYGVDINDATGAWSGYAWSENLGWISFNAADVNASCSGIVSPAVLDFGTGAVSGGAVALVYGNSDGCIELAGPNHTSPNLAFNPTTGVAGAGGVSLDTTSGKLVGLAWGADTSAAKKVGPGWVLFNPSIPNPVVCTGCTGGGSITGQCVADPAGSNIDIPANTTVTFRASAFTGTGPFSYSWNNGAYVLGADTYTTPPIPASTVGPLVKIRDSLNVETSGNISCPNITVAPPAGAVSLFVGRTVISANSTSATIRMTNPFVLRWDFTLDDDYTCDTTITPDPNNPNWNTYWQSYNINTTASTNGGTKTWTGNTGDGNLRAGTSINSGDPGYIASGVYQLAVRCTDNVAPFTLPALNASITVKITSTTETEI